MKSLGLRAYGLGPRVYNKGLMVCGLLCTTNLCSWLQSLNPKPLNLDPLLPVGRGQGFVPFVRGREQVNPQLKTPGPKLFWIDLGMTVSACLSGSLVPVEGERCVVSSRSLFRRIEVDDEEEEEDLGTIYQPRSGFRTWIQVKIFEDLCHSSAGANKKPPPQNC